MSSALAGIEEPRPQLNRKVTLPTRGASDQFSVAWAPRQTPAASRGAVRRSPQSCREPDRVGSAGTTLPVEEGSGPLDPTCQASPGRVPSRNRLTVVALRQQAVAQVHRLGQVHGQANGPDRSRAARTASPAPRQAQPPFRPDVSPGNGGRAASKWPRRTAACARRGWTPRSRRPAGRPPRWPSGTSEAPKRAAAARRPRFPKGSPVSRTGPRESAPPIRA